MDNKPLITEDKLGKGAKKINNVMTRKLGWIGVVVVSIIYLFWGFFTPQLTDKSLWEILLSSGISIVIAVSISNLLSAQGVMSGSLDEDVVIAKEQHIKSVNEANDYVEYSDEWADEENKISMRSARKHILMSAGLKYDKFFTQDGEYLDTEIPKPNKSSPKYIHQRYKSKKEAIKRALTHQVTPVSMSRISAETTVDLDPNRFEKEPGQYQKAKAIKSIWTKLATVAIFGQITWALIESSNIWESLFNGALQLIVFLIFGIISYYASFIYMTTTYVGNLRKKVNLLKRLINFGKQKMEVKRNGNKQNTI